MMNLQKKICFKRSKRCVKTSKYRLNLQQYGLTVVDGSITDIPEISKDESTIQILFKETLRFPYHSLTKINKKIINTITGEILPVVNAKSPFDSVSKGFVNSDKSRVYFLDAPGSTGKIITVHAIQSMFLCTETRSFLRQHLVQQHRFF